MQASHSQKKSWHILGGGALGCLWAALLNRCGEDVCMIVRNANTAPSNICYSDPVNNVDYDCQVSLTDIHQLSSSDSPVDQLILATKSYDAITALQSVLPLLSANAVVLSLCNGMGFHDQLAAQLAKENRGLILLAGVTSEAARLHRRYHVEHTGRGTTFIGHYGQSQRDISQLLPAVKGLDIRVSEQIKWSILKKFFINCAINPLTAHYACRNGELLENSTYYRHFSELCAELQQVFDKLHTLDNFAFVHEHPALNILQNSSQVALNTAKNVSSMLADRQMLRPLELDNLNGYLLRLADKLKLPCPLNRRLVEKLS